MGLCLILTVVFELEVDTRVGLLRFNSRLVAIQRAVDTNLRGGYKRWTNGGQTMDNPWINAASREFTVSSIGCAYRAELILGR